MRLLPIIFLLFTLSTSAQNLSGTWLHQDTGEKLVLSPSECFEVFGDNYEYYGIWAIDNGQLLLGFAQGGNLSAFEIVSATPGKSFVVKVINQQTGEANLGTYNYQGEAPAYDQATVARVLNEYQQSSAMNLHTQQTMHNINMRIINAMGGNSTKTKVYDENGNYLYEY